MKNRLFIFVATLLTCLLPATASDQKDQPPASKGNGHTFNFENIPLMQGFELYAELAGRTVLSIPVKGSFTLKASGLTKAQAALALEKVFGEKGIAVIPDGEKFVILLPKEQAAKANPHSPKRGPDSTNAANQALNLINVPLDQAVDVYAKLLDRKVVERSQNQEPITLRAPEKLTKEEVLYALDRLFEWRGVKIELVGKDGLKALEMRPKILRRPRVKQVSSALQLYHHS